MSFDTVVSGKHGGLTEKLRLIAYKYGIPGVPPPESVSNELRAQSRKIYINTPLPSDMYDEKGHLKSHYARNKIRTTKYTPTTFLPKNLFFQFTNIANSYFLLIVILGAFQIFGVPNPVLSAVPLIVIVVITGVKDAFEDYRRSVSDRQLNDSRIHLLTGMENHNVNKDSVTPWRRFKKLCTRATRLTGRLMANIFRRNKSAASDSVENKRKDKESIRSLESITTIPTNRNSLSKIPTKERITLSSMRKSFDNRSRRTAEVVQGTCSNPTVEPTFKPKFRTDFWKSVEVGNFVRVRNNEEVPADIVIIATSDAEGTCFVETKNLDGETNLKNRTALHCGEGIRHAHDLERAQMMIEVEPPNVHLYSFKGACYFSTYDLQTGEKLEDRSEPITNENVLLRGCALRNTKWVIGVVVYTGPETKVMLNSGITPTKKSRISKELNLSVIVNFVVLFVLCFVSAVVNGVFYNESDTSRIYFDFEPYVDSAAGNGVVTFFVALIIYQTLVPISLYISIEIIKTVQAYFIYADVKMYYPKLDYPCVPKSWNISDDLGQIEYIFSDKTGTLTQNVMQFKKCTVAGKSYGLAYTEAQQGMDKRKGVNIVDEVDKWRTKISRDKQEMLDLLKDWTSNELDENDLTFISSDFVKDLKTQKASKDFSYNERLMTALALCHTVVTEDDADKPGRPIFNAESPDEAALVSAARDIGIVFQERTRKGVLVSKFGNAPSEFRLLEIIPFNSTRKRMTTIMEIPPAYSPSRETEIMLYTKGADNVIYPRLRKDQDENIVNQTALHLEQFAEEGLRTLCVAEKKLESEYFKEWQQRYNAACSSVSDNREALIDQLSEEIECNLTLLGGTAIEDRLQDGVPDSIAILAQAGIKLWVLTGDKVETAINIGFSCNLLTNEMKLLVLQPQEKDNQDSDTLCKYFDGLISRYLSEEFNMNGSEEELKEAKKVHTPAVDNYAIIVDGAALAVIFNESTGSLIRKFLLLCKQSKSVLCCRVSPAQKAQIVKMVKNLLGVMTLAIGDGANDVAMIQAANVGVGIAGEEGRQAAMSSDYAFGQFRFLTRLLLVHGRWSYKRLAEMIPCFFYKNVTFTFTLFWYGIYNNFDGSYLFEYTYLMFYNLAFTSLPVIFLAILDQDVSETVSLLVPQLYRTGILRLEWSQYKFFYYMLDGLYQSVISFFFPYLVYHTGSFASANARQIDHRFWIGLFCAHISVVSCNIYVFLQQYRWDYLSTIIVLLSILVIFFWTGVWSAGTISGEFYKAAPQVFGSTSFWACFFVGVLVCVLPRFCYDNVKRVMKPRDIDIIRERVKLGDYRLFPERYDPTDFNDVEVHRKMLSDNHSSLASDSLDQANSAELADLEKNDIEANLKNEIPKESKGIQRALRSIGHSIRHPTLTPPSRLDILRKKSLENGSITSLERIRTSHELPGLTRAETLMSTYSYLSENRR
ncbi:Aminophospholipid translocase (flippase) [Komagataella phaffii CBS 7435]|uniref:Phospholipid-transporting ATPase n=2 Tax=Komagataella phaffii TaxID=460519 RepID=C4R1N5_KOMPG|nr:Aminophospholipid translocase (flippase) that localizes primarily to the plasma membrane [Komagataella phaffii GS115]AOA61897.1 GQ67_00825T0 [Komagataella phaffii]CAH2448058.1 Aminophospholipid translocase (flippase) [Komagataella phaffii CBS 7435]AOA67785.1 GQ68_00564T0 [Komagataella phaffii GS115]CAY69409.1 Aminophospholipid translocase (flippase) that localizes primarily to the plasma membrane [Komagataella phaffii GS115]CCA38205.1 Aminophospholipid translocase (flippase) [Komagataella p